MDIIVKELANLVKNIVDSSAFIEFDQTKLDGTLKK